MVSLIVRYTVDKVVHGQKMVFKSILKKVLRELETEIVNYKKVKVTYVENKQTPDIIINLVLQETINKECPSLRKESLSCSIRKTPNEIYFSYENWVTGANFNGSLEEYHSYLIKHEILHCFPFYLDHPSKTILRKYCRKYGKLPIMYQQTKGPLQDCGNSSKLS